MNAISRVQRPDSDRGELSLTGAVIKLHFQAYRACCNRLTNVACAVFNATYCPADKCLQMARRLSLVDIGISASLKVVNKTYCLVFQRQLIAADSLKTTSQKRHEKEIKELRKRLGDNSTYSQFCLVTANYIDAAIPRCVAEKLTMIPSATETWILYKLGYSVRYLNYQLNKRFHYREKLLSHLFVKHVQGEYDGFRTQFIHCLMSKDNLSAILDFEHVLLRLCVNISEAGVSKRQHWKLLEAAAKSLASSFSQQKKIDAFLSSLQFKCEEEAFIARLEWHKTHHALPKSLPDPHCVRLTQQNLQEKLDESLYAYLEKYIKRILTQKCPKQLESGLLGVFYFLEGKEALIQIFTSLIAEVGLKQLVDPHLFALAVLNGSGVEMMDYELEGFGRNKRKIILETGQKILSEGLKKASWSTLVKTFNESGLRPAPASLEGLLQKKEAKEALRNCIANMIYQMIKTDNFQHPSEFLKKAREKAHQLPFIGSATLSLHLLINGSLFSMRYLFRGDKEVDISYFTWMFKHLSGRKLSDYLAERIVELIYHPSWRMTLMHLIESLLLSLESQEEGSSERPQQALNNQDLKENLQHITHFIFEHVAQPTNLPFLENIGSLFDHLGGEKALNLAVESLQSSQDTPLLEKGLKSLLPTIKELLLYTRVIDSFRKEAVSFEGDAKFWEYFLRESLNQLVAHHHRDQIIKRPSLTELFATREKIVDQLLSMNQQDWRAFLSKLPQQETLLDSQQWEMVPAYSLEEEFYEVTSPASSVSF